MSGWQKRLARPLTKIEQLYDRWRIGWMTRFGTDRQLLIYPYIGHATPDTIYLRGRVVLSNKLAPPSEADTIWTNLKNTYRRFESDEIPDAVVRGTFGDISMDVTCDEEGFFRLEMPIEGRIDLSDFWQQVTLEVIETPIPGLSDQNATATGDIMVPAPNAEFAVISDLDDTILRTDVLNFFKMLHNTMLRNAYARLPFEGVAAFYHALRSGINNSQNPIFYVSSSPWNLYDLIMDFYKIRNIPLGPIYLRDIGLTESGMAKGHLDHKVNLIQTLMDRHPHLPFILIGDSGQKDARVYLEIIKRNPDRIAAVYIRDVARIKLANAVEEIAAEVKSYGVEMRLVKDTSEAAHHAAANGFIDATWLPQIDAEVKRDEAQASLVENLVED